MLSHHAELIRTQPDCACVRRACVLMHGACGVQQSPFQRTTSPTARTSGPGSRMLAGWWSGLAPGVWGASWPSPAPLGTAC